MSPQHFECKSFWHLCIVFEKFRMSFSDSLEGVVEAVTKAGLRLLFTWVTDTKNISSLVQCKQGVFFLFFFFKLLEQGKSQRTYKMKVKVKTQSCHRGPVDAFDPAERRSMWTQTFAIVNVAVQVYSVVVVVIRWRICHTDIRSLPRVAVHVASRSQRSRADARPQPRYQREKKVTHWGSGLYICFGNVY